MTIDRELLSPVETQHRHEVRISLKKSCGPIGDHDHQYDYDDCDDHNHCDDHNDCDDCMIKISDAYSDVFALGWGLA